MPESQNSPTEIGVITGLTGEAYAESDSGSRVLEPGSPIFQGEHLVTGPEGNIEVRFIDDTLLSQGGNSRITLDDYVYDTTDTSASELLLDITEGTFRVVTGKIAEQNPERFKVGSPLATIGIRGTITVHEVKPGGIEKHGVEEIHSGKALIVQSNIDGAIRQIANPLGMVDVSPSGSLSPVRPISPQELSSFREIAPANIREEQEIIQERQEEDEDSPDEDQDDAPQEGDGEGEGEALPEDVAPGGGEPEGGESGLQGAQGVMPGQVGEPPVGPPVGVGPENGRGGPEFAPPPESPIDEPPPRPDDPPLDPDPDPEPETVIFTIDDDDDDDSAGDDDITYNTITGTSESDNLTGTSGADKMLGLGASDKLYGEEGDDSLSGGDGDDLLSGGSGADTLTGDAGKDTLTGDDGNDSLYGGTDDDILYGKDGNDALYGEDGADTLNGGLGDDTLDGGTSGTDIDFASYSDATASVTVNLATNTATGADGNDVLNNIEGIIGSNSDDNLTGDGNANWFEGLNGNDTIDGGDGSDWIQYENASCDIQVTLSDAGGTATGAAGTDILSNIENVIGSSYNDIIIGSASQANTLMGGSGNDTITGLGGSNSIAGGSGTDTISFADPSASVGVSVSVDVAVGAGSATHDGGVDTFSGIESFIGTAYNDTFTGSDGAETFFGGDGNNTIYGGDGTDTISFADPDATVGVSLSVDVAEGAGSATHDGGVDTFTGIESFIGSDLGDTFTGSTGNETFSGGKGINTITGGGGNDTVSYADAAAGIVVGLGDGVGEHDGYTDVLSDIDNVYGSTKDDTIDGDGQANSISGNSGNDILDGGLGDDFLYGNGGDDTILAGEGGDSIDGGSGTDTLSFASAAEAITLTFASSGSGNATHGSVIGRYENFISIEKIIGSNNGDSLTGSTGNEHFEVGQGENSIIGGEGTDTLSYIHSLTPVTINGTAGANGTDGTVVHDGVTDTFSGFEVFEGSAGADMITGGTGAETFIGTMGNDTYVGGGGDDVLSYASLGELLTINMQDGTVDLSGGSPFHDVFSSIDYVIGSSVADNFGGKTSGAETIQGGGGNDTMVLYDTTNSVLVYSSKSDGGDTITNFNSAEDDFKFSGDDFSSSAGFKTISETYDGTNGSSEDTSAYFVFDNVGKALWYDSNGTEDGGNTLIATIDSGDDVTLSDITF
ncbi:FecR domain-containing protein [Maridesulfovibrio frigidus]|uniref:FecR domain-containing protein n=1 Tax=Maridesulfovibrio frigidus TaxID=340956 RepID=UPI0004E0E3EE|nr:FecR domain-containing protein [Maridesulfovibrio frigidus]